MGQQTSDWSERTTFVGFDWASDHHDVVVVDQRGNIVEDFRIDDTAEGWQRLVKKLSKYPDVAVAIETSSGATSSASCISSTRLSGLTSSRLRCSRESTSVTTECSEA